MVVGRQQKCGRVTTGFATCRTRYVLVHNKFATYYFRYTTEYIPLVSLGYPEPLLGTYGCVCCTSPPCDQLPPLSQEK